MSAPTKRAPRKAAAQKAAPAPVDVGAELAAIAAEPDDDGPIGENGEIRPVQIG